MKTEDLKDMTIETFSMITELFDIVRRYNGTIEINYEDPKSFISIMLNNDNKYLCKPFTEIDYAYEWLRGLDDYVTCNPIPTVIKEDK